MWVSGQMERGFTEDEGAWKEGVGCFDNFEGLMLEMRMKMRKGVVIVVGIALDWLIC